MEVDRYREKSLNDRTLLFCKNEVEDEFHFLFKCMTYNQERKILCLGTEETYVSQDKTLVPTFVMEHCPQKLAKYLLNALMKRTEMLKVLYNVDTSKVKCLQDTVVTCNPCWAGRTD